MKIALYLGGTSPERDVSISTGQNIGKALSELGHEVLYVDPAFPAENFSAQMTETGDVDVEPPKTAEIDRFDHTNVFRIAVDETVETQDFHFIALHGGIGENGLLQGVFEHLNYSFNGPGYAASAVAMDKHLSKQIMVAQGIPTPEWLVVPYGDWSGQPAAVRAHVEEKFTPPVVVKPNSQGSTIGLTVVRELDQLEPAFDKAFEYDFRVLVEQYVPGREVTAAILGDQTLPLVEIKPTHQYYDYECKYSAGMSEYVVPAELNKALSDQVRQHAFRLFRSIGAVGYSRADFRISEGGEPLCLELNTLPGMTETSLVPKAAGAAGYSFQELLTEILELGQTRF